jgi:hypothetical protein
MMRALIIILRDRFQVISQLQHAGAAFGLIAVLIGER